MPLISELTLQKTAQRIMAGVDPLVAVKEHIDEWNRTFAPALYLHEPALTGMPHWDAWLASAAHYESFLIDQDCPIWANAPCRFLPEPFFIGGKNSRMIALVETPFAFRMRMVFAGRSSIKAPETAP